MTETDSLESLVGRYDEFFHEFDYGDRLKAALESGKFRALVDVNQLREAGYANEIIGSPRIHMVALQQAAEAFLKGMDDPTVEKLLKQQSLEIGFEGSFGSNSVSPRGLQSILLNKLVEVEGIVTKVSAVRPKLVKSVQVSSSVVENAGTIYKYALREHRDSSSMDIGLEIDGKMVLPQSALPTKDAEGNDLEMEHGLSVYKDYQRITVQEMPERARVGQLPRSIEIELEHDLVDHVKPGDRIQAVGIYRPQANENMGVVSAVFKAHLQCNNISIIGKEVGAVRLKGKDVENIRSISEYPDILQLLADSLCPSIFGHEFIKRALILQLLGGCERNLENGTHLRGDINIMFVGDPSTAKSQLLRSIMDIAPLAISTTGRGSSGVGLTAAVSMDPETNEKRLEAGAMVLADRGVVCIDEFDKMGENDRVAIHEVMEQQTVTIAKAGIHASLNARCSVVSAANPIYGQYDKSRRPQDNIGLPDSLLSRFDLLFIVLDQLDPGMDRRLSEHVIRSHQYRKPGTIMEPESLHQEASLQLDNPRDQEQEQDTVVWQRGGAGRGSVGESGQPREILTKDFLRKYIRFAKLQTSPTLTDEAMEMISSSYANMRAKSGMKNLPVTARTLETIIRLSSASAKVRLSVKVETEDVDIAVELINFCLFHEIGEALEKVRTRDSMEAEGGDDGQGLDSQGSPSPKRSRRGLNISPDENAEPITDSQSNSQDLSQAFKSQSQSSQRSSSLNESVMEVLVDLGRSDFRDGDAIPVDRVVNEINQNKAEGDDYSLNDIMAVLNDLSASNKIMLDDDTVILC